MSEPALLLASPSVAPHRDAGTTVPHGTDNEPDLYDWSCEVPEWNGAPTPVPVPAPRRPGGPPRLTRRGRVVLLLACSAAAVGFPLLVLTAMAVGASSADASTENLARPTVVVTEGDTLWEIAERVRPTEDPRKTVDEIVEINELPGPVLNPGQELLLPTP